MQPTWEEKIQEVELALDRGAVDDAQRLLGDSQVRRSPKGRELANRVVDEMTQRAQVMTRRGDSSAAWQDLDAARALIPEANEVRVARDKIIDMTLSAVEQLLHSNDPDTALAKLDKLHQRNVAGGRVATLRRVVLKARRAQRLTQFGKFEEAARQWASARELRDDLTVLEKHERQCLNQARRGREMVEALGGAMREENWPEALDVADSILNMAPQHAFAREARDVAWSRVAENLTDSERLRRTAPWRRANPGRARQGLATTDARIAEALTVNGTGNCNNRRLQLWIDAVGGYLVCLADEVEIGQSAPGATADIPVFGNLLHSHARIRRDGESYILVPDGPAAIEGRTVEGPSFLSDGDELTLGDGVRFRFRRPHPLSATARLEPLSGHRTQPPADGVLLMAESCVLGPRLNNHVVCRGWRHDVILFRQDDGVYCRTSGAMEIDGRLHDGEGPLAANSHVCGEDFSLSVEQI
ncbi:MAG: hypothetical protein KDA41_02410 [Planctomycetales bacterium]|nr:hypothetical protein [Planctomycetales bacterium]